MIHHACARTFNTHLYWIINTLIKLLFLSNSSVVLIEIISFSNVNQYFFKSFYSTGLSYQNDVLQCGFLKGLFTGMVLIDFPKDF